MALKDTIIPVLIGADMNCYSMARAFHEEYGVCSYAFGRWLMGEVMYSRIVNFKTVEKIDENQTLLDTLQGFINSFSKNKKLIVIGCTDDYASMLMENREALRAMGYVVPYINGALRDRLVSKDSFYKMCDKYNIDYPKTFVAAKPMSAQQLSQEILGFSYPCIAKPSSSIDYWKHPFDKMKKVYVANNPQQAADILTQVYNSGYPDTFILQDMIPNDDSYMRVLTAYCDKNAKVKMMCLGHVGLEEHTPKALGNHAAIITEYNEPLMLKIKNFLEDLGYVGFANFDIKLDTRDGGYKVFEINLRQGRSNFYVTGAGLNLAKYLVRDWVLNEDLGDCYLHKNQSFWHSVPLGVVYKYVKDKAFVEKAKQLCKEGKESCTLNYKFDLKNPKRLAYYLVHGQRYYKKYKTYCK